MIRAAKTNTAKASIYLNGQLKATAPIKSGRLAGSVRRRPTKNGYSVLAGYTKDDVNIGRWVNQEFGIMPELPIGKASRFLKTPAGSTVWYGMPNGVRWTAKEYPWFDKNVQKAIKRYRAGYKNVRAALRG